MSVEVVSTLERKVNFNVSKESVKGLVATELKKYAKQAKVQGFRPGKAPSHIVEQMYGAKAYEDALNHQLNHNFVAQITEHKLNIIGYPKFDLTSSEGEEYIFAATFEVMPEVKLGDLSAIEIEKPLCILSDKDVETTIAVLRKQRATNLVSSECAISGDKVTLDFNGSVDGVPFEGGKAENYSFVLGQGMMLPDFETGVLGMKQGESKDVTVAFPETYHAENLKGKVAVFTLSIKEVSKPQLPELTHEFIQSLGIEDGTEETLRSEIKENLQHEVERRLRIKARDNALNALALVSPVEAPHALVHEEIHNMMKHAEENMKRQGYKAEQIKLTHDMFEKEAKNMVILRLLVQEFIKEQALTTSDADIDQVVFDMAAMYEDPADYAKWYLEDAQRVSNAKAMAMEQKVTEAIFALAKAKEAHLTYEDIMKMQVNS